MIVNPGQNVSFVYPTFDGATGLYVAGNLYDVSNGTPAFMSQIPMTDVLSDGVYVGQFMPSTNASYLVIMLVYTDVGLTIVDTSRAPGAENYDAFVTDSTLLNFNYGAYDQASNLTINATVRNLTDSLSSPVSMSHVLGGVYFGRFQGSVNKTYAVVKVSTDVARPPGADNFQAYIFTGGNTIINNFVLATLISQKTEDTLVGQKTVANSFNEANMIQFTQGDNAILNLTATDGDGNPVDLTGATFTTYIKSSNGSAVSAFNNSKHSIVSAPAGTFTLTLTPTDTAACGEGGNKEILTVITQAGKPIYFHGFNMLTVYAAVPLQ